MPRPLRICYEDAFYHVMNRGSNQQEIFNEDYHYEIFLNLLEETTQMFHAQIHAYCLMNNHYHLLISTPKANLSRIMRHIDGVYTQRYNRNVKRDGGLFRGRYKSIVVEKDFYLLNVSRYIHLNPVEAKIVYRAEEFKWSSYLNYINSNAKSSWLNTEIILNMMESSDSQLAYQDFVSQGIDYDTTEFYTQKKLSVVLGSDQFKNKVIKSLPHKKILASKTDYKRIRTRPNIDEILQCICNYYQIARKDILSSKRGLHNRYRAMVMSICRLELGYKNREIAHGLEMSPANVSALICSAKKSYLSDKSFKEAFNEIAEQLK